MYYNYDNPIDKSESFSASDIQRPGSPTMVREEYQGNSPVPQTKVVNSSGQMLITLTEAELDAKINKALVSFMGNVFKKQISENAIKKTIKTLISEGKLKVAKKKA